MFDEDQDFWIRETVSMLALASIKGVGYWTLFRLSWSGLKFNQIIRSDTLDEFKEHFVKADCKKINNISGEWLKLQQDLWLKGNQLYRRLKQDLVRVIHFEEKAFPQSLREIPEPPRWLFVQGDLSILHEPSVAVVGTREPSEDGEFLAKYIGSCIPYFGYNTVTVSGLASGIDQIIHKQSLRFKTPTIAVLGNGIFLDYPAGSQALRAEICSNGGAVITEYLPYEGYNAQNFVRRNRIQAGLSKIVIPVEWKAKSGTAHTVKYANQAGKHILCLRMPDWSEDLHSELILAKKMEAKIFTIPGQEKSFIETVLNLLDVKTNTSNNLEKKEINAISAKVAQDNDDAEKPKQNQTNDTKLARQLTIWDV